MKLPEASIEILLAILKHGIVAKGRSELQKYIAGKRLTPAQAIRAECYCCMNGYRDGKVDCENPTCSLHPFMPYNVPAKPVQAPPRKRGPK